MADTRKFRRMTRVRIISLPEDIVTLTTCDTGYVNYDWEKEYPGMLYVNVTLDDGVVAYEVHKSNLEEL